MKPTSYGDVNELLGTLLTLIQAFLGRKLLGLYLYGSATAGDFNHEASDVDVLAVIEKDLTEQEFVDLKTMHRKFILKNPEWKERIEVAYLSILGLQTFKNQQSKIVVISPGEPLNIKDAGNDWLINWYAVQENGIALFGPHQNTFIPKISKDEYIHAVKESAIYWRERIKRYDNQSTPGFLAYAVFTLCRAMYGYKKGKQASKKESALWVATEFPKWAFLIKDAAAWREAQWDKKQEKAHSALPKVVKFVNFAIDQILE